MLCYLSILVLLSTFIYGEAKPYYLDNNEKGMGEACYLRDNKLGTCQELSSCDYTKKLFKSGKTSEIDFCSFIEKKPLVCCPKVEFGGIQQKTKISQTKFQKALCKNVTSSLQISNHINNGERADSGEFPFQAALGYKNEVTNQLDFDCGGTLIADDIVLTAAHCVNRKFQPIRVRLGRTSLDLNDKEDEGVVQDIEIEKIIIHPEYSIKIKQNDIALIKLKKPAIISFYVQTTCLSSNEHIPKQFTIIGFGTSAANPKLKSNWLLKGTVKEYPFESCKNSYNTFGAQIVSSQLCATSDSGVDTCRGDSGGPLLYKSNGLTYQHGITSYGMICGSNFPAIYTKVSDFLHWIEAEMNKFN